MILENECGNNLEASLLHKNNNDSDTNNNQYNLLESLEDLFNNIALRNIGRLGHCYSTMPVNHDRNSSYKRYVHGSCCSVALWSTVMGYYVAAMVSVRNEFFTSVT